MLQNARGASQAFVLRPHAHVHRRLLALAGRLPCAAAAIAADHCEQLVGMCYATAFDHFESVYFL